MIQKNRTMRKFLIFNLLVITLSLNATAQDRQDFKELEDTSWKKITVVSRKKKMI